MLVDNTLWKVETPELVRQGIYHPIPWKFCADGTVSAIPMWTGVWQIIDIEVMSIGVTIFHTNGGTDSFSVVFNASDQSFTAFKNGTQYRTGKRIMV